MNKQAKPKEWIIDALLKVDEEHMSHFLIGFIEGCLKADKSPEKTVEEIKTAIASYDQAKQIRRKLKL